MFLMWSAFGILELLYNQLTAIFSKLITEMTLTHLCLRAPPGIIIWNNGTCGNNFVIESDFTKYLRGIVGDVQTDTSTSKNFLMMLLPTRFDQFCKAG